VAQTKSSSVTAMADRASTTTASPPPARAGVVVLTVAEPASQKSAQKQKPTILSSSPAAIPQAARKPTIDAKNQQEGQRATGGKMQVGKEGAIYPLLKEIKGESPFAPGREGSCRLHHVKHLEAAVLWLVSGCGRRWMEIADR
jgi:hypothetical protein